MGSLCIRPSIGASPVDIIKLDLTPVLYDSGYWLQSQVRSRYGCHIPEASANILMMTGFHSRFSGGHSAFAANTIGIFKHFVKFKLS
jgi:hypothetical protein